MTGLEWYLTAWLPALVFWGLWLHGLGVRRRQRLELTALRKRYAEMSEHAYWLEGRLKGTALLGQVFVAHPARRSKEVN